MSFKVMLPAAFLLCAVCAQAVAPDFRQEADRLIADGGETASGVSDETGVWLVAIGRATTEGTTEKDARAMAALAARKELASFLNAQVAAAAEMAYREDDSGESSSYAEWSKINVNEALKGVRIDRVTVVDGEVIAVAVMTEKTADATNRLRQAMAGERPGTVEAAGTGPTRDAAIQVACRSALEQVCGSSVVASDASADGNVRSRAFSDVQGMVSAYRIIDEQREGEDYRITIVAEIDKDELQESYGAQMKSIGDPIFWICSDNKDAATRISDFLIGKGLKTSVQQAGTDYKVELLCEFQSVTHPIRKRKGTQLQLTAKCYDKSGVLMFSLPNDPRKASVFTGNEERQKQLTVEKAVKQIGRPLHERLQRAVADMVNNGRTVRMVFRNVVTPEQCAMIERLTEVINDMPGASSATYSRNDAVAVSTIRLTLKGNPQDFLGLLRERADEVPEALTVSPNKIVFEL